MKLLTLVLCLFFISTVFSDCEAWKTDVDQLTSPFQGLLNTLFWTDSTPKLSGEVIELLLETGICDGVVDELEELVRGAVDSGCLLWEIGARKNKIIVTMMSCLKYQGEWCAPLLPEAFTKAEDASATYFNFLNTEWTMPSRQDLDEFCHICVKKELLLISRFGTPQVGETALKLAAWDVVCLKNGNEYCFLESFQELDELLRDGLVDGDFQPLMEFFCSPDRCVRKVMMNLMGKVPNFDLRELDQPFLTEACIRNPNNNQLCLNNYQHMIEMIQGCGWVRDLQIRVFNRKGYAPTCPDSCKAVINIAKNRLGCCMPTMVSWFQSLGSIELYDNFRNWADYKCSITLPPSSDECPWKGGSIRKGVLKLQNLVYDYYEDHSEDVEELIKQDLANNMFISPEFITINSIKEGSLVVDFSVQTESTSLTDQAISDYTTAAANDELDMVSVATQIPDEGKVDAAAPVVPVDETYNGPNLAVVLVVTVLIFIGLFVLAVIFSTFVAISVTVLQRTKKKPDATQFEVHYMPVQVPMAMASMENRS